MRERIYTVELEVTPSGLVTVARSSLPALYLSAKSLEAMLEALPRVIEHLFADVKGQHVTVERVRRQNRVFKNRAERRQARKVVVLRNRTEVATLALAC